MVIKIFYFFVGIFAVCMVILSFQSPYLNEILQEKTEIATIEINNVIDFEISNEKVVAKYEALKAERFKTKDEFYEFRAVILDNNQTHKISSNLATIQGKIFTLTDDVLYIGDDDLKFKTNELIYDKNSKILQTNLPFELTKYKNKIVGKNLKYDISKKEIFANGVNGWFYEF